MKRVIPILIIIILTGCKTNVDNWSTIEISGNVETKDIKYITFYPIENLADDENLLQKIPINNDGILNISYSLKNPTNAMIIIGNKKHMFFLEPGKDLSFKVKGDLKIEILEENRKNNSVFLNYQLKFSPFFVSNLNYKLNPEQFIHQVDSITNEKKTFLESNKGKLSNNFISYLENDILYFAAKEKIYYSQRYASHLIKSENHYFDFLNTINIQNNQAINVLNYLYFIDHYINYLYLNKIWNSSADYKNDYIEKYFLAKSELSGEVLEQFLTCNFVLGMDFPMETEKFRQILNEFLSGNYSENSKNIVKHKLSAFENSKIAEGKNAPEFSLKNGDNKVYSLADFKKEYIVLDFWASWCGPCKHAIPDMITLSEKYKDKAQFVFISIDRKDSDWKEAYKQLEIPEPSLIIDSLSRVNYGFNESVSVPFYLVLDNKGKVVLKNSTKEEIESILKSEKE